MWQSWEPLYQEDLFYSIVCQRSFANKTLKTKLDLGEAMCKTRKIAALAGNRWSVFGNTDKIKINQKK